MEIFTFRYLMSLRREIQQNGENFTSKMQVYESMIYR